MSVNGNPYGFYPDRTKYPLANLDGQLQPAAHNHILNDITNIGDLDDRYAFKNHQHSPSGLILPNGLTTGNVTVKRDSLGNYIFDIENNEPTGDPDTDAEISERIRKQLELMHMPESDMQLIEADYYGGPGSDPESYHSVIRYWLKGGLIVWSYAGDPAWATDKTEVKPLGYFKYPDGSPCPYWHAHGHLHFHQIDPTRGLAFLCHPTVWDATTAAEFDNAPFGAAVAMHKKSWTNPPQYDHITGIGVFVMTGEHFKNDGTTENPVWVQDRPPWVAGVYSNQS